MAEIQASVDYNILDLSGSPAPWPDVLAVYAVKTTSDPDNGLEVVTMDDARKELLSPENRSLWDALLQGTGTVPGGGMLSVSPIGVGTVLTAGWKGAPALSVGAPTKAVVLVLPSPNSPGA